MKVTTLGIDLAKSIFQLHGVDEQGKVTIQKRVTRSKLLETVARLPACLIGMEACGSAQYWAREFQKLGHTVKLISPSSSSPTSKALRLRAGSYTSSLRIDETNLSGGSARPTPSIIGLSQGWPQSSL